ncbi:hypothetical protein NDU88_002884 [Pleurodeles waltl]|uniref:Uncharacterized protein n=1 Tax=Pleurodeles waltl TaxID=8319 RepID=A0AAV7SET7_PLEWA|nr:hypothetical protein NDU88_002884 [Pleurodeles waltl]
MSLGHCKALSLKEDASYVHVKFPGQESLADWCDRKVRFFSCSIQQDSPAKPLWSAATYEIVLQQLNLTTQPKQGLMGPRVMC